MEPKIAKTIQTAYLLLDNLKKYQPELNNYGANDTFITAFKESIEDLSQKHLLLENVKNRKIAVNRIQKNHLKICTVLLKKIRSATRDVYIGNESILQKFHVNTRIPKDIKLMQKEISYNIDLVTDHMISLTAVGITEQDIYNLIACHNAINEVLATIEKVESVQNDAKKNQSLSLAHLKKFITQTHSKVNQCFINNENVLLEFNIND